MLRDVEFRQPIVQADRVFYRGVILFIGKKQERKEGKGTVNKPSDPKLGASPHMRCDLSIGSEGGQGCAYRTDQPYKGRMWSIRCQTLVAKRSH